MRQIRLFVSSPSDAMSERARIERVVSRLNGAYAGLARFETIRWETEFYHAGSTFQAQIPAADHCDIVVAIFKARLGTPLPATFAAMPDGGSYPSGTAFEVLTAIEAARKKKLPDVYVFRNDAAPALRIDDPARGEVEAEWRRLGAFFERWFVNKAEGFIAAFNPFKSTDDFERQLDELLRQWLADKVLSGRPVVWPTAILGSPFRGLEAFGAKHAPVFFGRARDTERSVDAWREASLKGCAFLLVNGLSGSGKSSLMRAGIVPRITTPGVILDVDLWRTVAFRPGRDPVATLARRLFDTHHDIPPEEAGREVALPELAEGDFRTPADIEPLLRTGGAAALSPLLRALDRIAEAARRSEGYDRPVRSALVVAVDQLDEIFAPGVTDEARRQFADLLDAMAKTGRIWVCATLRADLTAEFLKVGALRALREAGAEIVLAPPGAAELAEIVRAPAKAAGLVFELDAQGLGLDERLLSDADQPDMLPLLQLALGKVFDGRLQRGEETVLPFAAYDATGGGLAGLIDSEAEAALAGLGSEELARLLRLLVDVAHDGKLTIRPVAHPEAAPDEPARRLVAALVDRRILVSDKAGVHIAHQRVVSSWERARALVAENAAFYRVRDDVEAAERRWRQAAPREKRDLLLGKGKPVADGEYLVRNFGEELAPELKSFITDSSRHARRAGRIKNAAIAALVVLTVGAGYGGWRALQAERFADEKRREAEASFAIARQTIDTVVAQFAQGFKDTDGVKREVVETLLGRTREALEKLAKAAPNDLAVERSRMLLLQELADVLLRAGDDDGAYAALKDALDIARKAAALANGADQAAQRDLGKALTKIAEMPLGVVSKTERTVFAEDGLAIHRILAKAHPDDIDAQIDMHKSVVTGLKAGVLGLKATDMAQTIAEIRELIARHPDDERLKRHLAETLLQAPSYGLNGFAIIENVKLLRELISQSPNDTRLRFQLSIALLNLSQVKPAAENIRLADTRPAEEDEQEARSLLVDLAAADRGNLHWQSIVAAQVTSSFSSQNKKLKRREFIVALRQAVRTYENLLKKAPNNPRYREGLYYALDTWSRKESEIGAPRAAYDLALRAYHVLADIHAKAYESEDRRLNAKIFAFDRLVTTAIAIKSVPIDQGIVRALGDEIVTFQRIEETAELAWPTVDHYWRSMQRLASAEKNQRKAQLAEESRLAAADRYLPSFKDRRAAESRRSVMFGNLAQIKRNQGDIEGAIVFSIKAENIDAELYSVDKESSLAALNSIIGSAAVGYLYSAQKRDGDAERQLSLALGIAEEWIDRKGAFERTNWGYPVFAEKSKIENEMALISDRGGDKAAAAMWSKRAVASFRETGNWAQEEGRPTLANRLRQASILAGRDGALDDAIAFRTEEIAIRRIAAEDDTNQRTRERELVESLNQLGILYDRNKNTERAKQAYRESIGMQEVVVRTNPTNARDWFLLAALRGNLGSRLTSPEEADEKFIYTLSAVKAAREATKLSSNSPTYHTELLRNLMPIAAEYAKRRDLSAYRETIAEAIAAYGKLFGLEPDKPAHRANLANSHGRLGVALRESGDYEGALAQSGIGLELRRALAAGAPDNLNYARFVGVSLNNIGDIYELKGDLTSARAHHAESLAIRRALNAKTPTNRTSNVDLAQSLLRAARHQRGQEEASIILKEALELVLPHVAGDNPNGDIVILRQNIENEIAGKATSLVPVRLQ